MLPQIFISHPPIEDCTTFFIYLLAGRSICHFWAIDLFAYEKCNNSFYCSEALLNELNE